MRSETPAYSFSWDTVSMLKDPEVHQLLTGTRVPYTARENLVLFLKNVLKNDKNEPHFFFLLLNDDYFMIFISFSSIY